MFFEQIVVKYHKNWPAGTVISLGVMMFIVSVRVCSDIEKPLSNRQVKDSKFISRVFTDVLNVIEHDKKPETHFKLLSTTDLV